MPRGIYERTDSLKRKLRERMIGNTINLGREHNFLSKRIMSLKRLGFVVSDETRKKMSESRRGKVFSDETRKKMSESLKKRVWTKEMKKNLSISRTGNLNHIWKGGITPINNRLRTTVEYRLWRKSVFERDKYICQMPECGQFGGALEANHIYKFSDYPDLRLDIKNGITLCKKCHKSIHSKEEKFIELFINIIKKYD